MKNELVVSRIFNAPIENVWKVWTDPEYVKRWWGPDRFTCPSAEIDFREGGRSVVCMRSPKEMGNQDMYSIWDYKKIIPMKTIEFVQNLADKSGKKMLPGDLGMPPDFPVDVRTVVEFKEIGKNQTEMIVTEYADFGSISHFAKLGLEQSMDKAVSVFATQSK